MELLQRFSGYNSLLVGAELILQRECADLAGKPLEAYSAVIQQYRYVLTLCRHAEVQHA
jgi:hypothetical protein